MADIAMEAKGEYIGKVFLDETCYQGNDLYSDGDIEDELLSVVKEVPEEAYESVIQERGEWPLLYHLSRERGNIVDWIPFDGTEKVLEIGSGCGAITGTLARRCGEVTCLDLSRRRSLINATRHKERAT